MRVKLFSVLDDKLGQFQSPMAFQSVGLANRAFANEINREAPDNAMFQYSSDFSIYLVGEFDPMTGCFVSTETGIPVLVARGADVKA